jgi:AmmeMemoRadiSam system protein A
MLPADAGPILIGLARDAIGERLGVGRSDLAEGGSAGVAKATTARVGEGQGGTSGPGGTGGQAGPSGQAGGDGRHGTAGPAASIGRPAWLEEPGAAFVTLTINGRLRGCIGSLQAYRPLGDDVADNARAAAFRDPRFAALTRPEFQRVAVEVSVLSAPVEYPFASRDEALAGLRPGVDGVILSAAGRRATFLPQVWEELPAPEEFIAHLLRKAGLPSGYWGGDVKLWRYTVAAFHE